MFDPTNISLIHAHGLIRGLRDALCGRSRPPLTLSDDMTKVTCPACLAELDCRNGVFSAARPTNHPPRRATTAPDDSAFYGGEGLPFADTAACVAGVRQAPSPVGGLCGGASISCPACKSTDHRYPCHQGTACSDCGHVIPDGVRTADIIHLTATHSPKALCGAVGSRFALSFADTTCPNCLEGSH